ncbi:unnamed protein product [Dibothriocephalus latus]|uniref:Uncharacterized protein n=1 Tax=Dibothriocephalus latus TaxID=60516 RepID=A0A3P7PHA5_DIBLA|nr:unnamed protein product [Dibothriocephalus latus]
MRTYFKKGEKEGEDRDGGLLRETAWCLWTNYLAITGELGSRPWALAFQQVSAAGCQLLRSRQSFLSFSSTTVLNKSQWPRKPIKRATDLDSSSPQQQPLSPNSAILMVNAVWLNMQFRTKNFHWAGWGQIYNPKEAAGLSFHLFGPEPE